MKLRPSAQLSRRAFAFGLPAACASAAHAGSDKKEDDRKTCTHKKHVSAQNCVDANECMRRLTAMDDTADQIDWRFDRLEIMRSFQLARAGRIESSQQLILTEVEGLQEDIGDIRCMVDTCISGVHELKAIIAANNASLEEIVAQVQCINKQLDCLSCALCSLRGAIIRGKIFAFIVGFLMGMGVGAAIGGGAGGAGIASVAIW